MKKEHLNDLLTSINEATEFAQGNKEKASVTAYQIPDVKALRKVTGYKQSDFAKLVGVSSSLVEAWEQNKRYPTGSSLLVLQLIQDKPEILDYLVAKQL